MVERSEVLTLHTPVDELIAATYPGWPRRLLKVPWKPRAMPLVWINASRPAFEHNGWKQLDQGRVREARDDLLCFCCGESLSLLQVMGRHRASYEVDGDVARLTDGPGGHPRCMALATEHCPHLRAQLSAAPEREIAFVYSGPGLGYIDIPEEMSIGTPRLLVRPEAEPLTLVQLLELAESDPLGACPVG